MSESSLLTIVETARDSIERGDNDQAIEIGRRVLGFFPKYWAAYRLLGEASLEKGELEDAEDMFQRVLSVDPEDLLSRVGLATVHDRRGSLDLAIWHMERAYEVFPANAQLRSELQRLYLQRDGAARPRLKLSSGGVARLYARAGRWTQAAVEYRTLLEQNPGLTDVQVALAEALWNADRLAEAAQVCEDILSRHPYCLKACLILGEIWLRGDRDADGKALLQKALSLDPEGVVAAKVLGERSPLPLRAVGLTSETEAPVPLKAEQLPTAEPVVQSVQEAPSLPETAPTTQEKPEPTAPEAAVVAPEEEPIPEWLRRLRQQVPPPSPVEEKPPAGALVGEAEHKLLVPAGDASVPDWLERLRRRKQEEPVVSETEPTPLAPPEPPAEAVAAALVSEEAKTDEAPEWLKRLRQGEPESGAAQQFPAVRVARETETAPLVEETPAISAPTEMERAPEPRAETPVGATPTLAAEPARAPEARPEVQPTSVPDWLRELDQLEPTAEESSRLQPSAFAPVEAPPPARVETPTSGIEAPPPPLVEPAALAPVAAATPTAATTMADQALARAESLRDGGDLDASLEQFATMIENGWLLDRVEADLSAGGEGTLRSSKTFTLLGDLYMKQGKLQKALQAYKRALAQLG